MTGLRELLREAIEVVHQVESIRRHADPNDKTGWNVHGIETCEDPLCVASLAALAEPDRVIWDTDRLGRAMRTIRDAVRELPYDLTDVPELVAAEYDRLTKEEE